LQTIGALYPHTLILELPHYSRHALQDSLRGGADNEPARVYGHELHHWFDIVGTLWGQQYLDLVFIALDAVNAAGTEDHAYPAALRLFDADREILLPRYYKFVMPGAPHGTAEQWRNRWSVGNRIRPDGTPDPTRPIIFVRLETDSAVVARQPLSVGALLELRAMAAEDAVFDNFVCVLNPEEAIVERAIRDRHLRQQLYDPLLTTYSAAAHVVATNSGIGATAPVFAWGSSAADVCLNLEPSLLRKLVVPARLGEMHHSRVHAFRTGADGGFVFACLVSWVRENQTATLDKERLDAALMGIGLPKAAEIYLNAERALRRRSLPRFGSDRLGRIRSRLREAGSEILSARAPVGGQLPTAEWSNLPSPMVITGDCEQFYVGDATINAADAEWLHDLQTDLDRVTRQALRAARGLDFAYTDFVY